MLYFSTLKSLLKCEKGVMAIEYVLLAAGISLTILGTVFALGEELSTLYDGLTGVTTSE